MSAGLRKLGVMLVNDRCNARCPMCAGQQHRTSEPFNWNALQLHLMENRDTIEEISISGAGEPTLNPALITQFLAFACSFSGHRLKNLRKVKLYTNGTQLNHTWLMLLIAWKQMGLTDVYVSVPHHTRAITNAVFGINLYDGQPLPIVTAAQVVRFAKLNIRANLTIRPGAIDTVDEYNATVAFLRDTVCIDNIAAWVVRDESDKRLPELQARFESILGPGTVYDENAMTMFPDGSLRFNWC